MFVKIVSHYDRGAFRTLNTSMYLSHVAVLVAVLSEFRVTHGTRKPATSVDEPVLAESTVAVETFSTLGAGEGKSVAMVITHVSLQDRRGEISRQATHGTRGDSLVRKSELMLMISTQSRI